MIKTYLLLCPTLVLVACGPSSTLQVEPISRSGFANSQNVLNQNYAYDIKDSVRFLNDDVESSNIRLGRDDISLSGTVGVGPITVVLGGETFILERDPDFPTAAEYLDNDDEILLFTKIQNNDFAVGVEVFAKIDGQLNSGGMVIGYDTDPTVIAAENTTATYNGDLSATLRTGFVDSFGAGSFTLNANFREGTINGNALIEDDDDPNTEEPFDAVAIRLSETSIDNNGFAGNVAILTINIDGTLVDSGYEGRFFGPEGEAIGGQIFGRIERDGSNEDTNVEVIFLGNKEDE